MSKLKLTFLFSLVSIALMAQDKVGDLILLADVPESKALTNFAEQYAEAIQNNNYEKVAALTHADVVKMGGGETFIISDLKSEGDMLMSQGFKYTGVEVGTHPEFLKSEGQLQTVIPVRYYLSYNGKDVEAWTNLFASSIDEGVSWTFVNLEKFDEASLREFVSNVSPDLVFPTR